MYGALSLYNIHIIYNIHTSTFAIENRNDDKIQVPTTQRNFITKNENILCIVYTLYMVYCMTHLLFLTRHNTKTNLFFVENIFLNLICTRILYLENVTIKSLIWGYAHKYCMRKHNFFSVQASRRKVYRYMID